MPTVRIVVATDAIGALSAAEAGAAVATGWPAEQTTVVPLGEAGAGALQALADLVGGRVSPGVAGDRLSTVVRSAELSGLGLGPPEPADGPVPYAATSAPLGEVLVGVLAEAPAPTVVVDLAGLDVHDGGAGLLSALGVTADRPLDAGVEALAGIAAADLGPAYERLRGAQLVGLLPPGQEGRRLLGLRGITAARGRVTGEEADRLLATDAALAALAGALGVDDEPGLGAAGGMALAVRALGGRLVGGPAYGAELAGLAAAIGRADVVVTGCSTFDFAQRGGGVVAEVARQAEAALRPCVVVAGEVLIGAREMRAMGVEAAYAVRETSLDHPAGGDVGIDDLRLLGARVARSWRW